jgi:hypothetical protein
MRLQPSREDLPYRRRIECFSMDDDLSRVLMAVAHVMGAWDREMLIPTPGRPLLVEHEDGHWKLDERGYPIPSEALVSEYEYLCKMEKAKASREGAT